MATCLESIAGMGGIGSLQEIFPNTVMPFSVTSTANKLFRLRSPQFQSVQFAFNLAGNSWNTQMTVFSWNGATATPIGSASITSAFVSVTIDFPIGDYIICLRPGTATPQSGSFTASFTGYSQTANLVVDMFAGEEYSCIVSDPPRPPRECKEALYFEVLEGELPPGLQMDFQGTITGLLPNLDCLEDSPAPAVNWYFTDNDGTSWPWGRQWRFKVKVWVDGLKETAFDEDWFCVKIHNNWTFDLDNFMEQSPFQRVDYVRVVEPPKPLEVECAPCSKMEETQFIPQPIDAVCEPCQNSTVANQVELIAIPVELAGIEPNDIVTWYDLNKDTVFTNPYLEKFRDDLRDSQVFKIITNYRETNPNEALEYAVASNYQNYLQLAEIRLDPTMDPNNLAVLMAQWRDYMNQSLPTTPIGYGGETFSVNIA